MRYSYFPGCSLHSTGLEYGSSTEAVFRHLRLELAELKGWNCCGASSAHALNHTLATALPARTLALAEAAGQDLVTPCAACFNRLQRTQSLIQTDAKVQAQVEALLEHSFGAGVRVRPTLAVLFEDCGIERLAAEVCRPLIGLRLVTYYGCLLVRPPSVAQVGDSENPAAMAELLRALGAEVQPWSHATDCCGAGLSLSRADVVRGLVGRLAERAREAGAEAFATACPLCQVNLEMRQTTTPKLPAFYFTELIGLAFDMPEARTWWGRHLIDPRPLLRRTGLL